MKSKIYFYAVIAIGTMLIAGCSKNTTEPENKNRSPQISSIIPNPENVMVNQVTSLTCLAEDADGDQLTYVWEADTGTFNGTGSRVDWTAPGTEGLYQILCKVMDGNGGEAQQEVMIDVMPPGN
ncbi:MAG: hypothetical protein GWO08_22665, partial [Gammaproteobacteria bacterium]|nr:hypothetical protein [Gammaproteobacteria bacterium]NIT62106.1 hypothetical protein [Fodinibius sp.]NIW50533.1 hypothetical protein [Gammaproteobacteria bacterium]NIX59865.1 hypothetical protein [candidate division Zixibacteria bacterium]NIY30686.1 hypothetical protein [Fodinibius sp.]